MLNTRHIEDKDEEASLVSRKEGERKKCETAVGRCGGVDNSFRLGFRVGQNFLGDSAVKTKWQVPVADPAIR